MTAPKTILIASLLTASLPESRCESLVNAFAQVESGGHANRIGDHGRARGAWQFHREAWEQVTWIRAIERQTVHTYNKAFDIEISREYARSYIKWLSSRLNAILRRPATPQEIYAAWNLGLQGFAERRFRLNRCPASTKAAAKRVRNIVEGK